MPAARGSYAFLLRCALLNIRRALRAMHLALFTMLGPGGPGFPWEWDGFNGSPSGAATQSGVDMYPVSDGTPHAKQKVHGKLAPLSLASFLLRPSLAHQFVCKNCLSPALSIPMSCRRMSLPAVKPASCPPFHLFTSQTPNVNDLTPMAAQAGHYYEPWCPTYSTTGAMNGGAGMLPAENDWNSMWHDTSSNGFGGPGDNLNINPLAHY